MNKEYYFKHNKPPKQGKNSSKFQNLEQAWSLVLGKLEMYTVFLKFKDLKQTNKTPETLVSSCEI